MQSSPLPSSPPFMSGVCSSTFQSTLPSGTARRCHSPSCGAIYSAQNRAFALLFYGQRGYCRTPMRGKKYRLSF
ncbi:hypothetical protein [Treponema endosymbiont of Eucomonympha sp.]|uniref:hypothetical protein n=1 Tax=Treponema endosymbiont of Eucomonympha sp. TaxID=1580831 RepID=UPI001396ADCD|nr:hypothetical protein [Treponema endosymbiont of Eucomonympha sp.]